MKQIVIWSLFIVPYLSLYFLDRSAIRRYMPVALLTIALNTLINQMAWTFDWWKFKMTLFSWDKIVPLFTVYGVFFIGTIWIFAFTFRKFWLYMFVNVIVDLGYGFGLASMLENLGVRERGDFSPLQNLILMTVFAVILYVYQLWQEGILGSGHKNTERNREGRSPLRITWRQREKAR